MRFTGVPYCIKEGDTLWRIARRELGDPNLWSSIYAFNNIPDVIESGATQIKDPDLIFAGHQLNLPKFEGQVPPPPPVEEDDTEPTGSLKDRLRDLPMMPISIVFKLPDTSFGKVSNGIVTATARLKGKIVMTSEKAMPVSKVVGGGYELEGRAIASKAIKTLLSKPSLSSNNDGTFEFTNQMIVAGGNGRAPITTLDTGFSSSGKPIVKVTQSYPELRGTVGDYNFVTLSFAVEVELEKNDNPVDFKPRPVLSPEVELLRQMRTALPALQTQLRIQVIATMVLLFGVTLVARTARSLVVPIIMIPDTYNQHTVPVDLYL